MCVGGCVRVCVCVCACVCVRACVCVCVRVPARTFQESIILHGVCGCLNATVGHTSPAEETVCRALSCLVSGRVQHVLCACAGLHGIECARGLFEDARRILRNPLLLHPPSLSPPATQLSYVLFARPQERAFSVAGSIPVRRQSRAGPLVACVQQRNELSMLLPCRVCLPVCACVDRRVQGPATPH